MKRFLLILAIFLMTANMAAAQNAIPVCDKTAEFLFNALQKGLETSADSRFMVGDFRRVPDLDAEGLSVWACGLGTRESQRAEVSVVFYVNDKNIVHSIAMVSTEEDFQNPDLPMLEMFFGTTLGYLNLFGVSDDKVQKFFEDISNNIEESEWALSDKGKIYQLNFGSDENIVGFMLQAFTEH